MNQPLLTICLALLVATHARSAIINAESTSATHVQAAINAASAGDIVMVPSGASDWSTTVTCNKAITIQGAGIGQTIITNTIGVAGDGTKALVLTLPASGRVRVTGFTFDGNRFGGGIGVASSGTYLEFQIDNCRFLEVWGRCIEVNALARGLIYDCEFVDSSKTVDVYGTAATMNASWGQALTLGTVDQVVVEDCDFTYTSGGWYPNTTAASSSRGIASRVTMRWNVWSIELDKSFFPIIDFHGNQLPVTGQSPDTEIPGGTGDHRGSRQFEFYNNTMTSSVTGRTFRLFDARGGTFLAFNNTWTGPSFSGGFQMREEDAPYDANFRSEYPGYDQHRLFVWDNDSNGSEIIGNFANAEDGVFIIEGTNLFYRAPTSGDVIGAYTPLTYPHPWRGNRVRSPSRAARSGALPFLP